MSRGAVRQPVKQRAAACDFELDGEYQDDDYLTDYSTDSSSSNARGRRKRRSRSRSRNRDPANAPLSWYNLARVKEDGTPTVRTKHQGHFDSVNMTAAVTGCKGILTMKFAFLATEKQYSNVAHSVTGKIFKDLKEFTHVFGKMVPVADLFRVSADRTPVCPPEEKLKSDVATLTSKVAAINVQVESPEEVVDLFGEFHA